MQNEENRTSPRGEVEDDVSDNTTATTRILNYINLMVGKNEMEPTTAEALKLLVNVINTNHLIIEARCDAIVEGLRKIEDKTTQLSTNVTLLNRDIQELFVREARRTTRKIEPKINFVLKEFNRHPKGTELPRAFLVTIMAERYKLKKNTAEREMSIILRHEAFIVKRKNATSRGAHGSREKLVSIHEDFYGINPSTYS
jgi:hypothetical protein